MTILEKLHTWNSFHNFFYIYLLYFYIFLLLINIFGIIYISKKYIGDKFSRINTILYICYFNML